MYKKVRSTVVCKYPHFVYFSLQVFFYSVYDSHWVRTRLAHTVRIHATLSGVSAERGSEVNHIPASPPAGAGSAYRTSPAALPPPAESTGREKEGEGGG